ncbi:MAG: phosphate ABC transporter substrate-binding protein [Elusimicrobia bacterium]|nr:phosphate ABC transporter substrate-binding protein [Elusimicrobiota bacterium]
MKILKILLAGLMVCSAANLSSFAAKKEKIVCEGSTTVLPIAQAAAEEFMAKFEGDISVRGGGSGVGLASLIDKKCDICNSSRPIKDAELQKAAGRGIDVKANVIAMDGIAVIVNPSNMVNGLSKKQIEDIFTGKISYWSKAGGANQKIVVISRDSASGTFEAFGTLALSGKKVRSDALMQASNQAVAGIVAKTTGAIGYIGHGYINSTVKAVPINGIDANTKTILSGKYPYSRPLFMYTDGPAKGLAKDFIEFILSAEGQKIVEEQGFVALK